MVSLATITKKGKALFLAYDQGLEHGPGSDFNGKNLDPLYILEIAKKGKFQGVVYHKGIAEKYAKEIKASKVPLIVKLNGKTKLQGGEAFSEPICTPKEAKKLGAVAVGYTLYIGSVHEAHMFMHFGNIVREAHKLGMPVILWCYPRGKKIKNDTSREMMMYAARTGLELGADMVKIKYGGNPKHLAEAVSVAGRCKVVVAGGTKKTGKAFLRDVEAIMKAGASGLAVGRNVWQSKDPYQVSKDMHALVF